MGVLNEKRFNKNKNKQKQIKCLWKLMPNTEMNEE